LTKEGRECSLAVVDIHTTKRRYATILADPPWFFHHRMEIPYSDPRTGIYLPYSTMRTKDIAALPVERIALSDCQLWLWTTNATLPEAIKVLDAWGFQWRTMRTWCKPRTGMGVWLWGQSEHIILATRGRPYRPKPPILSTLLTTPNRLPHSRKPRQSYQDIEAMSKEPRIELFARRARKGWDSWGLEAKELDRELERDVKKYL